MNLGRPYVWHPYTQMKNLPALLNIEGGDGVYLHLRDGRKLIDGISSWWSVIHGYNHPELNEALVNQVKKVSHVMLGGVTHQPAKEFANKLVEITPPGLNHVFFSDSGSVGVEIALKIAIQYWANSGMPEKSKFLSLRNSYHGDTFKAMQVGDDSDFQKKFGHTLQKDFFLDTPQGGFNATKHDLSEDIDLLNLTLQKYQNKLAAFILEPLVQCAGGFKMYSPQYLLEARILCDKYNVLFIFDEVATGFGRTGKLFASDHASVSPDIMILGKALTAGYIGHSATLTKNKVFENFYGNDLENAFMHGTTFMGNPLACAVGLKSIDIFQRENYLKKIEKIEAILIDEFAKIKSEAIVGKRVLGAIGAIEVGDAECLKNIQSHCIKNGVWLRPFGKYIYAMPPYIIEEQELRAITQAIKSGLPD